MLGNSSLFIDFFEGSNVGLAVFDSELRCRALNSFLAEIDGLPTDGYLGKTVREVLGEAAAQMETAIQQVLATGRPISNIEIKDLLPARGIPRRWVDNLFPLRDGNGRVTQVGVVVVELTPKIMFRPAYTPEPGTSWPDSKGILRSWKEIAKYSGTCIKTIQRWEQQFDFPVRRLKRSKGALVFAVKNEVDNWMQTRLKSRPCA